MGWYFLLKSEIFEMFQPYFSNIFLHAIISHLLRLQLHLLDCLILFYRSLRCWSIALSFLLWFTLVSLLPCLQVNWFSPATSNLFFDTFGKFLFLILFSSILKFPFDAFKIVCLYLPNFSIVHSLCSVFPFKSLNNFIMAFQKSVSIPLLTLFEFF